MLNPFRIQSTHRDNNAQAVESVQQIIGWLQKKVQPEENSL